ncbi:MAG TPA: ComF family protein [Sphingomonas sp.]|nr:ComF family protein [Sphingomonas sp.]
MLGKVGGDPVAPQAAAAAIEDFGRAHRVLVQNRAGRNKSAVTLLAAPFRAALDFALPPRCPGCGAIVSADGGFCSSCWSKLDFLSGPACAGCGLPFEIDRGDSLCGACLAEPPPHDGVRAVVAYGDVARALVLKLKHGRRIGMARVIGGHLARAAQGESEALLVPVPLHRWRVWPRGFNQSALIANDVARRTGLQVRTDLIERRKPTPMLGKLGRAARARALRGAFAVPSQMRALLKGRTVLLVDDVYTSGATAGACARVLKRAGAAKVVVLCWARVLAGQVDDFASLGDGSV